eukprot:4248136-Prymnesium_polylepis.4
MSSKAAGKRRAVAPSEDDSHSPVVQDIDDDHDAAEQSRDLKVEQAPIKRAKASGKARAADSEETQTYENGVLRAIVSARTLCATSAERTSPHAGHSPPARRHRRVGRSSRIS